MTANNYAYDFVLTLTIEAGKSYTSTEILAMKPTGTNPTTIHLMSDTAQIGISTATSASNMVTWKRGDFAAIISGRTWTFGADSNVDIALAELVTLV